MFIGVSIYVSRFCIKLLVSKSSWENCIYVSSYIVHVYQVGGY